MNLKQILINKYYYSNSLLKIISIYDVWVIRRLLTQGFRIFISFSNINDKRYATKSNNVFVYSRTNIDKIKEIFKVYTYLNHNTIRIFFYNGYYFDLHHSKKNTYNLTLDILNSEIVDQRSIRFNTLKLGNLQFLYSHKTLQVMYKFGIFILAFGVEINHKSRRHYFKPYSLDQELIYYNFTKMFFCKKNNFRHCFHHLINKKYILSSLSYDFLSTSYLQKCRPSAIDNFLMFVLPIVYSFTKLIYQNTLNNFIFLLQKKWIFDLNTKKYGKHKLLLLISNLKVLIISHDRDNQYLLELSRQMYAHEKKIAYIFFKHFI